MSDSVWGDESLVAREVVAWASDRVSRPSNPRTSAVAASVLKAAAGHTITAAGIGATAALEVFDKVLVPATRAQDDPMNLAYIPSAPTRAAVAFDLATSAANVMAGMWETGAGAIFAENEALTWIRDLLGWPTTAGGTFVAGGTSGNLAALHTARTTAWAKRGTRPEGGWTIACAHSAHSSIRSAAQVMDVAVIDVPEDRDGRLSGNHLRPILESHHNVFAVVASAGSTNAGIVDDLASIAAACQDHDIWLHVDGAYGGGALAAPSVRSVFDGIERADSFIVDPHKWLFAPYDSCALLYRDPALARAAHSQTASYLDAIDRESPNPTDLAIHLSRRARGLPFWFSLATHGTAKYSAAVEQTLTTAKTVAAAIDAVSHLRLLQQPMLSIVLFDRPGWSDEQYRVWSKTMAADGVILCVPTTWQGKIALRLAFVNPATRAEHVIAALDSARD